MIALKVMYFLRTKFVPLGPGRRRAQSRDNSCFNISISHALCRANWSSVACQSKNKCRGKLLHCWQRPSWYEPPCREERSLQCWPWKDGSQHGPWSWKAEHPTFQGIPLKSSRHPTPFVLVHFQSREFIYTWFQVAAYDKTQMKMAFFDPSRPQDFLFISGTKVKFLPVLLVLSSS